MHHKLLILDYPKQQQGFQMWSCKVRDKEKVQYPYDRGPSVQMG